MMHVEFLARKEEEHGSADDRKHKVIEEKESYRWIRTLQRAEDQLPVGQHALFIQDREADIFALFAAPKRAKSHILVRANQPRRVEVLPEHTGDQVEHGTLFDVACAAPVVAQMNVTIPRGREQVQREAILIIQCAAVRIIPPDRKGNGELQPVCAWVIRACELHPPADEEAVEWVLVTTPPIPDGPAACQMVQYYTRRWRIERFHYTIKTGGCDAEQLHMDDANSIMLALALYYVAAWRLLYIDYYARTQPNAPPRAVFRPLEIEVLEMIEKRRIRTLSSAVAAMAKLGGYEPYKNGPLPGIKVMVEGYSRMEDMESILIIERRRHRRHGAKKI